jgi:two-component system sensor histidine kinase UhpB
MSDGHAMTVIVSHPAASADGEAPARAGDTKAAPWASLIDAVWRRRSVRAQTLITFVAIGFTAVLIAGIVTIVQARKSTRVEIAASLRMAEILVGETAELLQRPLPQQQLPAEEFLTNLPAQLRFVRHLRVSVRDAAGLPVTGRAADARGDERPPAPAWFAALIAPPVVTREVPVVVKGERVGSVLLAGEPADEIAEVWENSLDFLAVCLVVGLVAIAVLYVLLGRVLDPLTGLSVGLADLEHRNYRVRLGRPNAPELAAIIDRFNALAEALDAVRGENATLNRRLITAQDDERRRTALELHDEVGPLLFGLKAHAGSIANAAANAASAGPEAGSRLRERAGDMLAIVEQLQAVNRSMLNRLRPMALGHVPLGDLLSGIVRERAREHAGIAFHITAGALRPSYGDSIDLTIYRCVQEGLTNAIRHARATTVAVEIGEADDPQDGTRRIDLAVRDDGCGMAGAVQFGRGLLGMQERVHALGGECSLERRDGGTVLRVAIPRPESIAG